MGKLVKQNKFAIVFYALLFSYFNFSILKLYGFSIFPDEFSYWAYAARVAGYDWSEVMSLGSFYSYGYSVFLIPIFYLCKNALTAYRTAIALNFILIGIAYGILCRIQNLIVPVRKECIQIYAAIAMFYPAVLFYAQTTMAETLLTLGYLMVLLLFERYLRKPDCLGIVLLLAVNFFMYLVHMRTIGIFAVSVCLLIVTEIKYRKDYRRILLIVIIMIALLCVMAVFNKVISIQMYPNIDNALYEVNTYTGQFEKIKFIFSMRGIFSFVRGFCGKLLYLGISTYGMAYWGIVFLARKIGKGSNRLMAVFILLSTLSQMAISTIYNVIPDSCDSVTFGRYQDHVTPILIVAGINEMISHLKSQKRYLIATSLSFLILTAIILDYVTGLGLVGIKGYFMAGMSFYESREFSPVRFYMISCLMGILCMCCFVFIFFLCQKINSTYILIACVAIQLLLTVQLGNNYIVPFNRLACKDIKLAERIEQLSSRGEQDRCIVYIDYNDISAIGLMQFALRDEPINVVSEDSYMSCGQINEHSIVLLGAEDPAWEKLQKVYDKEIRSGHFVLLYNDEETGQ